MLILHGMPDLSSILLVLLVLLAVKLIGYSLAGWTLQRIYGSRFNFFLFAIIRIATGFIVGLVFLIGGLSVGSTVGAPYTSGDTGALLFFVAPLVLARAIVWALLVFALYEHGNFNAKRFSLVVVGGTILSCVLDFTALLVQDPVDSFMNSFWV
jgi:hypothetical protein